MSVTSAIRAIVEPNLANLSMGPRFQVIEGMRASISNGEEGIIYAKDEYIEAVGFTAVGLGKKPNEDSLGVWKRDDGKYLFHVADGMGGHEGGSETSAHVIKSMQQYLGIHEASFKDALKETILQMKARGGTTYTGMLLPNFPPSELEILSVGDSQVTVSEKDQELFTSIPHNVSYTEAFAAAMAYRDPTTFAYYYEDPYGKEHSLEEFLAWDRHQDVKQLLERIVSYEVDDFLNVAGLLFQYKLRDATLTSFLRAGELPSRIDARVLPQKDDQMKFLYTDGVGDLFTPVDIIKSFQRKEKPLYEQAYYFAVRIMMAQERGRQIDLGIRPLVRVDPKHDNYAFWVIRRKAGESSRVKGEREEQNGDQ